MPKKKLSPDDHSAIAEKAAEGWGGDTIASWLLVNRGIKITGRAVRDHLASVREERVEIAQSVIAEKLSSAVVRDVDVLGETRLKLEKLAKKLFKLGYMPHSGAVNGDVVDVYLRTVDRLTKILALRIAYAGGGGDSKGNGPELPSGAEERAKVLRALAEIEESKR